MQQIIRFRSVDKEIFIWLTIHISPIFSHNNHTDKQTAAVDIKLLCSSGQIRKMQEEKIR